jgi:hypothetical protein
MITNLNYPNRIIYNCLKELEINFSNQKQQNSPNNYLFLNKNFLQIYKKIYDKYENLESIDNITKISKKIDNVKDIMHENITKSLENVEKLEEIELKSSELQISAGLFRKSAKELKSKMWWKNIKIKLIIGSVIMVILGIIIAICVVMSKNK